MKLKGLLMVLALVFGLTAVQAQDEMFKKFSDNKDITTVYISKALLSMVPDMETEGVNIKGLANKLEQLEVYTTESKDAAKMVAREAELLKKNKTYETLMTVKDKGQLVDFYALKSGNDRFKALIMFVLANEDAQSTVIRIMGDFTMEDIQKVMEKAHK